MGIFQKGPPVKIIWSFWEKVSFSDHEQQYHEASHIPLEKYNIVMIPNQSTAVSTGANGLTPEGFSRNRQIQSYGNNAQVAQSSATTSPVDVDI